MWDRDVSRDASMATKTSWLSDAIMISDGLIAAAGPLTHAAVPSAFRMRPIYRHAAATTVSMGIRRRTPSQSRGGRVKIQNGRRSFTRATHTGATRDVD